MVLISEHLPAPCATRLRELGYTTVALPADPRLSPPVASHPDMLVFLGRDTLVTDRTYYVQIARTQIDLACAASGLSLCLTDEPPRAEYPHDIRFNAARVGTYLFCYPPYTSPAVLALAEREKLTVMPIRQGYARCSICPVGNYALITADPSVARAADKQKNLDILTVHQGHVLLPGYPHGFLGGCCGADRNHIYFSGDPAHHPDGEAILTFIRAHGMTPVVLMSDALFDGGSLLFLPSHAKG